jgi:hypothetical protein
MCSGKKHNREFIPMWVGKGLQMSKYHSKIEGRAGTSLDKRVMKWLFCLGALVLFICLYTMIGKKF